MRLGAFVLCVMCLWVSRSALTVLMDQEGAERCSEFCANAAQLLVKRNYITTQHRNQK